MQEQYGKYVIKYEEFCEKFVAYIDGVEEARSEKLSMLKKRLDALDKEKDAFVPVEVFQLSESEGEMVKGRITSKTDSDRWVKWEKGSREKVRSWNTIYLDTAENRAVFYEWKAIYTQIKELEGKLKPVFARFIKA